jgi:hypothetical protein
VDLISLIHPILTAYSREIKRIEKKKKKLKRFIYSAADLINHSTVPPPERSLRFSQVVQTTK